MNILWGMFALLNLWKPTGISSYDCIRRVRRCVGRKLKVGHAGTLDPLAEGVLVVCLGPATRLVELIQACEKEYVVVARLGAVSTTDDAEGRIEQTPGPCPPAPEAVESAAREFVGRIEQVPPAHSAVKVAGKRAYRIARSGEAPDLAPRTVAIASLEVLRYEYPHLHLRLRCGSGTYVRSLVRDIGRRLGVGGYVQELLRSRIGPFRGSKSVALDQLRPETIRSFLISPVEAVPPDARVPVTDEQVRELALGRTIDAPRPFACRHETLGAIDPRGELVALVRPDPSAGLLKPTKVFARPPAQPR